MVRTWLAVVALGAVVTLTVVHGCCPTCHTNTCIDFKTDNANCGACGNVCGPGTMCSASACRPIATAPPPCTNPNSVNCGPTPPPPTTCSATHPCTAAGTVCNATGSCVHCGGNGMAIQPGDPCCLGAQRCIQGTGMPPQPVECLASSPYPTGTCAACGAEGEQCCQAGQGLPICVGSLVCSSTHGNTCQTSP